MIPPIEQVTLQGYDLQFGTMVLGAPMKLPDGSRAHH
jgi:hypothetical protein